MRRLDDLQAKKQLLIAQAEFDRLQFAMAVHDLRRLVRLPLASGGRYEASSMASRVLRFVLPVVGRAATGRIVSALSIALSVYRFLRGIRAA